MAAGETVTVPVAAAPEMQGGGGSSTASDDQEQQLLGDGGGNGEELGQQAHQPKQSLGATGDLWPTSVVDSLIDQFEDIKVLKLNMGNLRSQHWVDIAASLNSTFKTSYDWKQCKNKVDLLIRLYKKSKLRMLQTESQPTWRFFDRMDSILGRSFKAGAIASASNSRQHTRAHHSSEHRISSSAAAVAAAAEAKNTMEGAEDEEEDDDENDEPPGHCEEEEQQQQQTVVSSPRTTSERGADEIDFRAVAASVRKKSSKKSGRSSTSSALNLLVGALDHYTQAFERCKQMEIDAQLRMSQESRAFQLQIAEMQLEVTKEIVRVLGKRRRV